MWNECWKRTTVVENEKLRISPHTVQRAALQDCVIELMTLGQKWFNRSKRPLPTSRTVTVLISEKRQQPTRLVEASKRQVIPTANSSQLRLRLPTLLPKFLQNRLLQCFRLRRARPPLHHLPVRTDQELLEIPLYPLHPHQPRDLLLHPLKHRLRFISIHVCLPQDGEGDTVVDLAELLDRVVVAGVLLHELVAGEAEDDEAVGVRGGNGFVEGFEGGKLRREAAFAGGVDDEDDFTFEGGEGVGLPFFWGGRLVRRRSLGGGVGLLSRGLKS